MAFHDFAWYCSVAFLYLCCAGVTAGMLARTWRKYHKGMDLPWGVIFMFSLFGPVGIALALAIGWVESVDARPRA